MPFAAQLFHLPLSCRNLIAVRPGTTSCQLVRHCATLSAIVRSCHLVRHGANWCATVLLYYLVRHRSTVPPCHPPTNTILLHTFVYQSMMTLYFLTMSLAISPNCLLLYAGMTTLINFSKTL